MRADLFTNISSAFLIYCHRWCDCLVLGTFTYIAIVLDWTFMTVGILVLMNASKRVESEKAREEPRLTHMHGGNLLSVCRQRFLFAILTKIAVWILKSMRGLNVSPKVYRSHCLIIARMLNSNMTRENCQPRSSSACCVETAIRLILSFRWRCDIDIRIRNASKP